MQKRFKQPIISIGSQKIKSISFKKREKKGFPEAHKFLSKKVGVIDYAVIFTQRVISIEPKNKTQNWDVNSQENSNNFIRSSHFFSGFPHHLLFPFKPQFRIFEGSGREKSRNFFSENR